VVPRVGARRLALLAAVAAAGELGTTRDRLIGLFWPEVDEDHGRHSLRQALYALREEAGPVLQQAGASLFLNPALASSDIAEFRAALAAGELATAARLYRGTFLDGFYLVGAEDFERWVETERARLAGAVTTAVRTLATQADDAGTPELAIGWWDRLSQLEPLSGRTAVAHARALVTLGDRARALAVLRAHKTRVRRELESDPDREVAALIAELQRPVAPEAAPRAGPSHGPVPVRVPSPGASELAPVRPRRGVQAGLAVVAVALLMMAARMAGLWGTPTPETGTESAVALRFYEEGLENFRGGRVQVARPLMEAALREDTTFAMAAYYLALMGEGQAWELRQRALRLAQRAPLSQRMQIQAEILQRDHDPAAVAVAREWTERFPGEGQAFAVLGATLQFAGDWAGSAAALERSIALMEARGEDQNRCGLCGPLDQLINLYLWWDSLPAVERVARRSLMRYPDRTWPVAALAVAAARSGDSVRAMQHLDRLAAATEGGASDGHAIRVLLTLEAYDAVIEAGRRVICLEGEGEAGGARWMTAIALRNLGRLEEAQRVVSTGRLGDSPAPLVVPGPIYPLEGIIALERGDPVRAAELLEIQGTQERARAEGVKARWRTWQATLVGTALAAAGDTSAVRALADTAAYWGARSLYGRDQRSHHFLRGLLLAAQGQDAGAVDEYREAIFSPSLGYTRVNLELGRALIRLGRGAEAVPVLQAALRGEVDASNLYVTRTELHEVLGDAFRQAGQVDSAAVHLRAVVRALAGADRTFSARRIAAERWLRQNSGGLGNASRAFP